jgi:cytoskeleton protein RodZ
MPEIGATLREARMRARIDISDIEAETKIRAKYLRALENEEWGLLPGPAYVRSFLRTYAEALDLDAKLLLEEYKLRYERPSDHDLMPIGAPRRRGSRGGRNGPMRSHEPRRIPPGVVVGVIIVLLAGALYLLGRNRDDTGSPPVTATTTGRTTTTPVPARTTQSRSSSSKQSTKPAGASASSRVVKLEVIPTGPTAVYACVIDATGTARLPGNTLRQGGSAGPYRSKTFSVLLGNGNARLRIDGKVKDVPEVSPIGLKVTKKSVKQIAASQIKGCS